MSHASNTDTIAKDHAGSTQEDKGEKLPASTYGFPNHEDGIQSGDTTKEENNNITGNIPIPPNGLAGG